MHRWHIFIYNVFAIILVYSIYSCIVLCPWRVLKAIKVYAKQSLGAVYYNTKNSDVCKKYEHPVRSSLNSFYLFHLRFQINLLLCYVGRINFFVSQTDQLKCFGESK